jgi:predicted RNA-binding protein with PIN domain
VDKSEKVMKVTYDAITITIDELSEKIAHEFSREALDEVTLSTSESALQIKYDGMHFYGTLNNIRIPFCIFATQIEPILKRHNVCVKPV